MAKPTRRLAAIMFTDIVGYTSLMGADEKKAFDTLKKNRRIHWRLIKKYRGRFLKEMGDGTLASFSSSMDAVMCAISIQLAAEELDIPLRVGIHQGDVIFEQKDVLGDGVNIASRVQGVASTQGIAISETIYQEIRNKEGLEVNSLGTQSLKGVSAPMHVYKVSCSDPGILDYQIDTGELLKPMGGQRNTIIAGILMVTLLLISVYAIVINPGFFKKRDNSVLVLPFDDFSGVDSLDYMVAGMHDALIVNIGRISSLRVLGKTTAKAYKNTDKSLTDIGRERKVNTIIEGALSCFGEDSLCFLAKVIEVYPREKQIGSKEFRVSRSQIPLLYNMVTKELTKAIDLILTPKNEKFLAGSRTVNKEVYDEYMKAQYYLRKQGRGSLDTALYYLNIAIEKEPDWAPLYAALARVWIVKQQHGFEPSSIASPKIYKNLDKAIKLDPDLHDAHTSYGLIAHVMEWNWDKSEQEYLDALAINPNDARTRVLYAQLLCVMQRMEEGIKQARLAFDRDPLNPSTKIFYAAVLYWAGDSYTALALAEEVLAAHPDNYLAHAGIQVFAYPSKEYEKLIYAEKYFLRMYQVKEEDIQEIDKIFKEYGVIKAYDKITQHLEEVSENNSISPIDMAYRYIYGDQPDKAIDWLEKGYEMHDPAMTYITTGQIFAPLFNNPRFIDIVEKMNLPLPEK